MPISNKEKERIRKIRLFEEGIIPFDNSMFKIKIGFYKQFLQKIKHPIKIDLDIKNTFKALIFDLIYKNLIDIKIYDIKINVTMLFMPVNSPIRKPEKIFYMKIDVNYKSKLLFEIIPDKIEYEIYENNKKLFYNSILLETLSTFDNTFKNAPMVNNSICIKSINNTVFGNKKFEKFRFYQDVKRVFEYIIKNNFYFNIRSYYISYDFSNRVFKQFCFVNKENKKFYGLDIGVPLDNLGILHILYKIKLIDFDINELSEREIFEMYELLNY